MLVRSGYAATPYAPAKARARSGTTSATPTSSASDRLETAGGVRLADHATTDYAKS